MKKRVFNLLILVVALATTFSTFSQRKVEATHLIVKSAKNAAVLGTDETGRVVEKELDLDLSNLVTKDSISDYIPQIVAGNNITIDNADPKNPVINATSDGVSSIVAGTNITIDNSDPLNPIVNSVTVGQTFQQTLDNGNTFNSQILGNLTSNIKLSKEITLGYSPNKISENIIDGSSIEIKGREDLSPMTLDVPISTKISFNGIELEGIDEYNGSYNSGIKKDNIGVGYTSSGNRYSNSLAKTSIISSLSNNLGEHTFSSLSHNSVKINETVAQPLSTTYGRGEIKTNSNGNDFKVVMPYSVLSTSPFKTIKETITFPLKTGIVALTNDIPQIQAGTNVAIDNTDPSNPIINVNGGINSTDLTYVPAANQGTVESSNGTDAVIPQANLTNAGLMRAGFESITTETVTATMIAHQDNVINGAGSFALNDPDIKVNYTKTGRLKRMTFNVGISYTSLEPTDVGDWIVKIPTTIHGSAGEGMKLPLLPTYSQPDTFDAAFNKEDRFSCKGYFETNTGEIILKIKLNPNAVNAGGSSGVSSFNFNLVYRTDS